MIRTTLILLLWVAAVTASGPAHAYLDPGTGSMILQGILGAIAVVGMTARIYWHRIKTLLSRMMPGEKTDRDPDQT